jgi:[acyl-carrier-protein] S-malonyltransferase
MMSDNKTSRALVFAGQGAQFVGMGKDLAEKYPECKALFEKADEVLGYELSKVCFEGPAEELTKSNHCQPAIFVTSIACHRALGVEKGAVGCIATAGLSLGEWSALHVAGALTFEDTLRVLEARGRFMQEACEERDGTMVSVIGLSADKLADICTSCGVEISNLNSAEQTVLSGDRHAVETAEKAAAELGAKRTVILNVAGAYHSSLMNSAAERLKTTLADVNIVEPTVSVLSNVTGQPHAGPEDIRGNMVKQVTSSVRWFSSIEWLKAHGADEYLELGPGKVLSGLIKRIDRDSKLHNIQDCVTLEKYLMQDA